MDNKPKRALVTGSTSGIGLGIAETLARAGCDVALNGFGETDDIEALKVRLASHYKVRVIHVDADVSDGDACRSMVRHVQQEFDGLDVLVNNAGIQHVAAVEDFPKDRWDAILAINLSSAFHAAAAALPAMLASGFGRILNIASVHGLVGSKHKSAYVAAKHGLIGLTKVIALETAGTGVTCNAICPGWVLTPLVEKQITARMQAEQIDRREAEHRLLDEKQPSRQFATPEQIGDLAVFLCSPAAANITGASLPIDGGWTAQ